MALCSCPSALCRNGKSLSEICYLPLAEDIPITFNSVRKGPRSLDWRDDKAAELSWIETQAGSPQLTMSCALWNHCLSLSIKGDLLVNHRTDGG